MKTFLAILVLSCTACATGGNTFSDSEGVDLVVSHTGHYFDAKLADSFAKNVSTREVIESEMGKPDTVTKMSNGIVMTVYNYFASVQNSVTGQVQMRVRSAVYTFDADGILRGSSLTLTGE
jgi:hypothetical protein